MLWGRFRKNEQNLPGVPILLPHLLDEPLGSCPGSRDRVELGRIEAVATDGILEDLNLTGPEIEILIPNRPPDPNLRQIHHVDTSGSEDAVTRVDRLHPNWQDAVTFVFSNQKKDLLPTFRNPHLRSLLRELLTFRQRSRKEVQHSVPFGDDDIVREIVSWEFGLSYHGTRCIDAHLLRCIGWRLKVEKPQWPVGMGDSGEEADRRADDPSADCSKLGHSGLWVLLGTLDQISSGLSHRN